MGNGPGGIDQYEAVFDRYPRLHGGFVWEWRDHGIRARTAEGVEYFAYGGDFGEVVHDGNFVTDGMVLSDGTPSPGLHEFAHVVAPSGCRSVRTGPRSRTAGTPPTRRICASSGESSRMGCRVADGVLDVDAIAAGNRAVHALPDCPADLGDGEVWLTVEAVLAADTPWAAAGHRVVAEQRRLQGVVTRSAQVPGRGSAPSFPVRARVPCRAPSASRRSSTVVSTSLGGLPVAGPWLELWRAPTDNDRAEENGSYDWGDPRSNDGAGVPAPSYAQQWLAQGLDRLAARIIEVDGGEDSLRILRRYAPANSPLAMLTEERWVLGDGLLELRIDILPSQGWNTVLPRIGVRFDLPEEIDGARWFGTGPHDSYPDSRRSARVGRFEAPIDDLTVPYARPQESGHRSDLRTLVLRSGGEDRLRLDARPDVQGRLPGFTLTRHTAQDVAAAAHPHEIRRTGRHYLYLDAAQNGLGSRACGPDVWPDAMLRAEARTLTLTFGARAAALTGFRSSPSAESGAPALGLLLVRSVSRQRA